MATTFTDFLAQRLGTRNWVVARRTARIVRKYGANVATVSQKRFSALAREFEQTYGEAAF